MTTINITRTADKLIAETPYNKNYIKAVKDIDGKWDPIRSAWIVSLDKEQELRDILERVYGWTEDKADKTLRIRFDARIFEVAQGDILLDNIRVALRWTRNEDVTMCNGAKIVEGTFGNDGKSTTRPHVVGSETTEEVIVEMEISQSDYDNLRDDTKEFVEIVSEDEDTEDEDDSEEINKIQSELRGVQQMMRTNTVVVTISKDGETPMYRGAILGVRRHAKTWDDTVIINSSGKTPTDLDPMMFYKPNGEQRKDYIVEYFGGNPDDEQSVTDVYCAQWARYEIVAYVTEPMEDKDEAERFAKRVLDAYRRAVRAEREEIRERLVEMGVPRWKLTLDKLSRRIVLANGRY